MTKKTVRGVTGKILRDASGEPLPPEAFEKDPEPIPENWESLEHYLKSMNMDHLLPKKKRPDKGPLYIDNKK